MATNEFIKQQARCPECFSTNLDWENGEKTQEISCKDCNATYGYLKGRPVLMNKESKKMIQGELSTESAEQMQQEYQHIEEAGTSEEQEHWLKKLITPPEVFYYPNPDLQAAETKAIFDHNGEQTQILNVGGGPIRYQHEISLNLQPFVNVNLVGDAHNIPFQSDSFDSVICNAVLEHVPNPQIVVDEIIRVLKPGGLIYLEVPFLFFYHGYPNDYHRFTKHGLTNMLKGVDVVNFGITQGPVSAILLSMNRLLNIIMPFSDTKMMKVYNGVFRWLFFPFKYLDKWLIKKPESHVLAGGFYVLGKKQ